MLIFFKRPSRRHRRSIFFQKFEILKIFVALFDYEMLLGVSSMPFFRCFVPGKFLQAPFNSASSVACYALWNEIAISFLYMRWLRQFAFPMLLLSTFSRDFFDLIFRFPCRSAAASPLLFFSPPPQRRSNRR